MEKHLIHSQRQDAEASSTSVAHSTSPYNSMILDAAGPEIAYHDGGYNESTPILEQPNALAQVFSDLLKMLTWHSIRDVRRPQGCQQLTNY